MSEPFIGEIRMFAGKYAPKYWSLCDGQAVAISSNTSLYSLLHNTYGGDGISTFCLPDLRGRVPVGEGTGMGLTRRSMGQQIGTEIAYLGTQHVPPHTHALMASLNGASTNEPQDHVTGNVDPYELYETFNVATDIRQLNEQCIESNGGNQPHGNIMPFMGISFIISMEGIYPPRS